MSNKFLKSKLTALIKKEKHCEFKKKTYYRLQKKTHMVTGIWKIAKNPKDYNNKEIITYLKSFLKKIKDILDLKKRNKK